MKKYVRLRRSCLWVPFVAERREGIWGDFIAAVKRHSLCVNCVLEETQKRKKKITQTTLPTASSDKNTLAVGGTHPEETVHVLREDSMPSVVCVRVGDCLNARSQELVPQKSSIGHCVCDHIMNI